MTSFRPIRAQHSLTAPQTPEVTARREVTPPEVPARPEVAPQTPEVTARPEVTPRLPEMPARPEVSPQTPGSDRATRSQEMTHSIANKNHFLFNTILRCHALVTIGTCVTT